MKTSELLKKAHALISDPAKWTQGWFAKTKTGEATSWNSSDAERYCSIGALYHVNKPTDSLAEERAYDALEKFTGGETVGNYNDSNPHPVVMEMWRKAIAAAEAKEAQPEVAAQC